jgi:MYXO-CTERM domain-containing protein
MVHKLLSLNLITPKQREATMKSLTKILTTAVSLFAFAFSAQANIILTTDTDSLLEGTWDVTGDTGGFLFEPATNFVPLLPGGFVDMILNRDSQSVSFGTNGVGTPDNPFFTLNVSSAFTALEFLGEYNNNASNTLIQFAFTNLSDTGGVDGTFTGNFCLSADLANCGASAEPVSAPVTLGLLLLGALGLSAAARRHKR